MHPTNRSGDGVGDRTSALEHGHAVAGFRVHEADGLKCVVVPLTTIRRLANQQTSALGEKAGRAFDGVCRRAKASACNDVIPASMVGPMGRLLGSSGDDIHSVGHAELDRSPHQECRALRCCVEQHTGHVRRIGEEWNSGKSATGTKIDEALRIGGNEGAVAPGVLQVNAQRARTEETYGPSPFENGK